MVMPPGFTPPLNTGKKKVAGNSDGLVILISGGKYIVSKILVSPFEHLSFIS